MKLSARTPVLVGVKTVIQREEDPTRAKDAVELMAEAVFGAGADAMGGVGDGSGEGSSDPQILGKLDEIISMSSMTRMTNPAFLVAEEIAKKLTEPGKKPKTVLAEVGVLQQAVFDRACQNIQEGEAQAVLVIGGETQYRALRSKITGVEVPDPPANAVPPPDAVMQPDSEIVHPLEIEMGLYTAPSQYTFLENAFGHAKGLTPAEQRLKTAELWESFNQVAGGNPTANFPSPKSAKEIAAPTEKNRIIAAPYNKWNCSQINVDQASALLFVSAELADEMQLPEEKRVFPHTGAVSNYMVPILKRRELDRCAGFNVVGKKALEQAVGGDISKINHFDLYSCFPVAVWVQAQEMGIEMDVNKRPQLTVTGGMTFGGGPLNSYVLGSLVKMAEVLRADKKGTADSPDENFGLVSSISGMISKQGVGIWSTNPPEKLPQFFDLSDEVKKKTGVCEVEANYRGNAATVSSTMLYDGEGKPARAVCIADIENGKRTKGAARTMAFSENPKILSLLEGEDYLGRIIGAQIEISEDSEFSLL